MLAVALGLRLRLAWESVENIVVRSTPDDAYYYLQIARNLAHGHNVTFDGETVTNGFHPLWLVILTPIFWFADGEALPIHIALTIGAGLGAATVFLIYLVLMRLTDSLPASLIGAGFYALHPQTVADSVNGVESALVVVLFTFVVWLLVRSTQRSPDRDTPDDVAFGVACGLMILARTDTAFVVPPLLSYMAWKLDRQRLRHTAIVSGATFATLIPWLIWSIAATGTIIQISGVASGWFARGDHSLFNGDLSWSNLSHGASLIRRTLFDELMHRYFVPHHRNAWLVIGAGGALVGALCFLAPPTIRDRARRNLVLLAVPTSGLIAALVFHAGYRWQVREWYYTPMGVAGALYIGALAAALAVWVEAACESASRVALPSRTAVRGFFVVVAAGLFVVMQPLEPDSWVFRAHVQSNHLAMSRWIDTNTESDARIGSFNAGILGYFSNRTVVNLDGVVNADAFDALQECDVVGYVQRMQLDYVVDLPSALRLAYCGGDANSYTLVATVGQEIIWPDKGLLQALRVDPADN